MKSLLWAIKREHSNKFVLKFKITESQADKHGNLQLWELLQCIEEGTKAPRELLIKIAPEYKSAVHEVNLQLFEKAHVGDEIEVEARFYELSKRNVLLKVFVRLSNKGDRTKRIARAEYTLKSTHIQELMKSA